MTTETAKQINGNAGVQAARSEEVDGTAQINELVKRFASLQASLGLSDKAFASRYRKFLTSEKSWLLLKRGDWAGKLNLSRWLGKLQALSTHIEASQAYDADEFLGKLPFVQTANAHFERLMGSNRDRRIMAVLAPEGVGKSWWASSLVAAEPGKRVHVSFSETWRNKPLWILMGIADKLNIVHAGARMETPASLMMAILESLRSMPEMVLLFDEAHHGGSVVFPLLKEINDKTPARSIYMAFPTQFDAARRANEGTMAESRQFLRRCIRPVFDDYRYGIGAADVEGFLAGKGFKRTGELKRISEGIAPVLAANGNLTALADAMEEAEIGTDGADGVTLEAVTDQVYALCSTAKQRRKNAGR